MTSKPNGSLTSLMLILIWIASSCSQEEIVPRPYRPKDSHDAYRNSLKLAKLDHTALGKDWLAAAGSVFEKQVPLQLPYQEAFHMDPKTPGAMCYRFAAKRGHKVVITMEQLKGDSSILFIDAFRVVNDSLSEFRHVASADSTWQLAFEPRRDADYLLRLQPELLRGGNYKLDIQHGPALEFPVAGKNKRAIHSFFGDPRDGGRREHHGVDIFAKKGTPIVSPAKGYVRFVGTRGIGGKVVWIYDQERRQSMYFAHLDTHLIKKGVFVNPGDTIGTVGNTGNARFTPPHLHFGIYSNGPIDPYAFIAEIIKKPTPISDHTNLLGQTLQTEKSIYLLQEPRRRSQAIDTLSTVAQLQVEAVHSSYLRVVTAEGKKGYLSPRQLKR